MPSDGPRRWKCPECGHEKSNEYEKERPFCGECEFRDGVLIEMQRRRGTEVDQ